ncbi:TonB-dependent receptor [Gilvimarinus algae]|uniref:TonB-dependent receptor n=1 Tax=Gilvimarinus algae TaxID=3058037 RepID=A0ABT8TGM9_9GAMM|nr:TonB-dependent receptor [Gilvimarinus sp. SDUM040014]MDO3381462.1 TonB-dependent receptor [Gilvimarinus sp. SDUM040014]
MQRNNTLRKLTLVCSSISTAALMGAATPAFAQSDDPLLEEVVVSGIRGSLATALDTKRDASSVLDSVSAEDIGKFPDKNIGDALQRVPGVTVIRGFGEVTGVTIRGTAPQHSVVLLNGQNVGSVGWFDLGGTNRSFNFELLSAEQISGMDIYKSVEANVNEGAIGGTVNLKTRRPLDMDAFTFFGSVEAGYSESAEEWAPSYSGLASWKNDNENFGILLAYSNEQQNVVRETLSSFGVPDAANGLVDDEGNPHAVTWGMSSILFDEERERESTQATLQFAPIEALTFTLDYHLFSLDNDHINTAMFAIPAYNGAYLDADTAVVNAFGATTEGTVIPSDHPYSIPMFNNSVLRTPKIETDVINFTAEYEGDGWSASFITGRSDAKSRTMQTSTWWGDIENPESTGFTFNIEGPHELMPSDADYPMSHDRMHLFNEFTFLNNLRDNEISYTQADFSLDLDMGILTTVEMGLKYQDQMYAGQVDNRNVDVPTAMADGLSLADFNGGHVSGLFSQDGRSGTLDAFAVINRDIWDYGYANQADTTTVTSDFSIDEEITAAYVKANFEGDGFRGNLGLRAVDTEVLSKGRIDGEPAQGTQEYTNLLPSANLVIDITENLLLRFAAGSTVSRPDYEDMQMAETIQINIAEATVGNPEIKPYKSDQYDVGLEWYFSEASLIGATVFQKNISDYIQVSINTETLEGCGERCQVKRARNVGTANISGIELQYQHDFGNGFGVQANYTYTDSSVTDQNGKESVVDEVSQNSYNLSGYFENGYFSARLAYNFRDGWHNTYNNSGPTSMYDDYDQLDGSLIWHATDYLDLSFEAVNILNETLRQRQPEYGVMHSVDEFGARYYIGASVNF